MHKKSISRDIIDILGRKLHRLSKSQLKVMRKNVIKTVEEVLN